MKANEIKVGGVYEAKVSNRLTNVKVTDINPHAGNPYACQNLSTGRMVYFKTAGKFRREVKLQPEIMADERIVSKLPESFNAFLAPAADLPHMIVEARAGTGKTTTLVEGIRLVMGLPARITPSEQQKAVWEQMELSRGKTPRGICFVAFNKSIATELQERVPPGSSAMTMHSMGFKAVQEAFGRVKVESWRVQNILSVIMEKDIREIWKEKAEVIKATGKLVGLCKLNLIDHTLPAEMFREELDTLAAHYDVDLNGDREEVYSLIPQVLARCLDVRGDMMIDFNDMIWLPVALDLSVRRYSLLLVDEAQDMNRCQQALAKKAGERLILCGDPKQAIYGFAGADAESMIRMTKELQETPAGCKTLPLTVTRRCGKAIVEEAKKIVEDFDAFETNPEGKVSHASFKAAEGQDYTKDVFDGDFILCRVNAPLVSQCFRFLKAGRKANIQGKDIGAGLISLIKKQKVKTVVDLIPKLEEFFRKEEEKENKKRFPNEARRIALQDRQDCLMTFCEGYEFVEEVIAKIESVFTDDRVSPGIKLSSIHKSKGLEAKRVFFLVHKDAPCPHPMAESEWQMEQEWNLRYVAITRAIEELVFVA
jgi:DNA helicase-2/ATP-dependent DNA helicase PcrA